MRNSRLSSKRNGHLAEPDLKEELCSLGQNIYTGQPTGQLGQPGMIGLTRSLPDEFRLARCCADNFLVQSLQKIRLGFLNFGFEVGNENTTSIKKPRKFTDWWDLQGDKVWRFVRDVWREWMTITNVVVYWYDMGPVGGMRKSLPIIINPEEHRYSDKGGIERLWVTHKLTADDILLLPAHLQALYRSSTEIEILAKDGQYFKVLKNEGVGKGLGRPEMRAIFTDCQTLENVAAGDNVLGLESKNLVRQHTIGHETRYGLQAGSNKNFITKPRRDAVERGFKGKMGLIESFANFDQLIKYFYIDTKWFDPKKMQGAIDRILLWSQPVGQMSMTRGGVAPFLMDLMRVQADQERMLIGPFVKSIIKEVFPPPTDIEVCWSNRVFRESRLQADLLKFGLINGLLSQCSTREEIGFDDEEERERKQEEDAQPDAQKMPVFNPGGQGAGATPRGRPVGQPDEGKTQK